MGCMGCMGSSLMVSLCSVLTTAQQQVPRSHAPYPPHPTRRQKVKEDMTRTWRKIYEANYPRSLDHRSFYFKQQEKKNMMTKVMVSEVKEAADRRKADESHLRGLSMAHRYVAPAAPPMQADLTLAYTDK